MTGFTVRDARAEDAPGLCDLLNAIVRAGGTTARLTEMTVPEFEDWYISGAHVPWCLVAVAAEVRLGFQGLSVHKLLPAGWVDIGTFTQQGSAVRGVGTALFTATRIRAAALGFSVINATIRADNAPGLAYYAKMGFRDYKVDRSVPLADGRMVDRVNRRFDLITTI
jgi:L-amino acid N-acyltransferase YncA